MNKLNTSILLCLLMTAHLAQAQTNRTTVRKRTPAQATTGTETTTPTEAAPETADGGASALSPDATETPATTSTEATPAATETPAAPTEQTAAPAAGAAVTTTTPATIAAPTATTARPRPKRLPVQSISAWSIGVTTLQWNEPLRVTQLGQTVKSNLNFNGAGISLQKETYYLHWGWSFGGLLSAGRANGGPADTSQSAPYNFSMNRQAFTLIGITPRMFWRLTNMVNIGGTAFVYLRNIDLPSDPSTDIQAGRRINAAILADMNLRMFKNWDFYQAIGPVGDGATMWKLGVSYRF